MKRLILLCLLIFVWQAHSSAQLRVAITGGGHQSSILEKNNLPGWDQIKGFYKGRGGAHFGFLADLPLSARSGFFFQPAVLYYPKGRKYNQVFDTTVYETLNLRAEEFVNYIDLPLNLVYKLKLGKTVRFIVGAGPYLSFFYNGKMKTETVAKDGGYTVQENNDPGVGNGPGKYKTLDYGVNGLAGFEFGRVFLTANYSRGLSDFYQPVDYTASEYKHEVKGISLGIYLGKPVMPAPEDSDGDGVPDKEDKCPALAGLPQFEGCPDTDGDGIPDGEDSCPGEAGPLANKGCPWPDTDGDGVLDKDDKCPDIKGMARYNGCPIPDTDGDGINDEEDKCPTVKGVARYNGCPVPDTDGDGINDEEDKCPTVKGVAHLDGCPEEVKKEIVEKVNYAARKIQFKVNSASLLPASYKVLDEVAELLQANPELKVEIEGHTSREGAYELNKRLSLQRAGAVKAYLESKGVDGARLTATGYGPDKPVAEGDSPAARAQNRRVELVLSNQ